MHRPCQPGGPTPGLLGDKYKPLYLASSFQFPLQQPTQVLTTVGPCGRELASVPWKPGLRAGSWLGRQHASLRLTGQTCGQTSRGCVCQMRGNESRGSVGGRAATHPDP